MATRIFARSILASNRTFCSSISRSYSSLSAPTPPFSPLRLLPLVSVVSNNLRNASVSMTVRGFSTRRTTSSLNDSNPNWSNRPPTETILLDGCDFEHWLVVMEKPEGDPTRDEIIDGYVKTLAKIVGSEAEARMKLYSVSTRCYYAFGALVSEEDSYKLKELEGVRWVLPDSYLDVRNKDYGGEPVINGVPVPYDPKYHEEWIRNNSRANERNRRNDRPRNFDRSRNFERRRENFQTQGGPRGPLPNMGGPPPSNMGGHGGPPPGHMGGQGGPPPSNMGGHGGPPPGHMGGQGGPPPSNMGGPSNNFGGPQNNIAPPPSNNWGGQPHSTGGPTNYGGPLPNNWQGQPPSYNSPNTGEMPNNAPNYQQQMNGPNSGGMPYQAAPGPNRGYQNSYGPNGGGGNPYQTQNMPGRDMPPPPTNYQ